MIKVKFFMSIVFESFLSFSVESSNGCPQVQEQQGVFCVQDLMESKK